jgi:hypothetical protein
LAACAAAVSALVSALKSVDLPAYVVATHADDAAWIETHRAILFIKPHRRP